MEQPVAVRLDNLFWKSFEERPRKAAKGYVYRNRTKTDTGRRVEHTQALGRTLVKELCKMAPYVRNKERLARGHSKSATATVYQKHRTVRTRKWKYTV